MFPTVPIDYVIPHTLHLFLRITDNLFNILITDVQRYDGIAKATISSAELNPIYLQGPEFFINVTCKIPLRFSINKESKQLQWQDLIGPEKNMVLDKINLSEAFPNLPNIQKIQQLWKDFKQLYGKLQQLSISSAEADNLKQKPKCGSGILLQYISHRM